MSEASAIDFSLKFCIIGPQKAGKTCIRSQAFDDVFHEEYVATIGPECSEKVDREV